MIVCSVSTAIASSSLVIASSPAISLPQSSPYQQQPQRDADSGSAPLRGDADETREVKLLKCLPNTSVENRSLWQQHQSMNGGVPVPRHRHNSPDHSPRRLHRSDASPYHVRMMDRSPLNQQPAERSILLTQSPHGGFSNSWNLGSSYSSYQRNGLISADERMDTSDEMPLNLSTGVRSCASSAQQFANVDSRRRILTSGK